MPISEYLHFLQMYIVNFSHQSNSRFTHVCQSLYCQSLKIIKSDYIFLYCLLDYVNPSFEYLTMIINIQCVEKELGEIAKHIKGWIKVIFHFIDLKKGL